MRSERRNDRVVVTIILVILASALAACGNGPTGPAAPEEITELPRALTASERTLIASGTRFGLDLLGVLAPGHRAENLFFSPLSASVALGMTINGAAGDTYDQMASMLGYEGLAQEEINAAYASLIELLTGLDPTVTVELANAVWHRTGLQLDPTFLQRVESSFAAEVDALDTSDPAAAVARVNGWVSEQTHGTIEELLSELPANLVALLVNAVYFEGSWTDAFDPDDTRAGDFRAPGGTVTADFMHKRADLLHGQVDGHDVVELPYGGKAFAMTLVLPAEGTDAADLAAGLDPAAWDGLVGSVHEREVLVELPKFELEWTRVLNDDLRALGMVDAFDGGRADLSRMVPGGGVWIDEVRQKAFVKVDEEGTVASAATSVSVVESLPPTVRFDRPFLLAIRERLSGALLFLGVVRDPS